MSKKARRYFFLLSMYLAGILLGGIYTPKVILYAKQPVQLDQPELHDNIEKQKIQKKSPWINKHKKPRIQIA